MTEFLHLGHEIGTKAVWPAGILSRRLTAGGWWSLFPHPGWGRGTRPDLTCSDGPRGGGSGSR